jgi:hypothetical protein
VAEHVVPIDVLTDWAVDEPHAVLLSDDEGTTALALAAHRDDADQRCVALVWRRSCWASLRHGPVSVHPLYEHGLCDVHGVGIVRQSERVAELAWRAGGELVHHIVLLSAGAVEVVAEVLTVERIPGTTSEAAAAALATNSL